MPHITFKNTGDSCSLGDMPEVDNAAMELVVESIAVIIENISAAKNKQYYKGKSQAYRGKWHRLRLTAPLVSRMWIHEY